MQISNILEQVRDKNDNIIYERDSDGYYERNTYVGNQLVRSEIHYANGITEVEQYNISRSK